MLSGRRFRSWVGLLLGAVLLSVGAAPAAAQTTGAISIAGTMEGNLWAHPGDYLDGGYDFTIPGTHQTANVAFPRAMLTFHYSCSGDQPTGAFTLPLNAGPWDSSVGSNGWSPSGQGYGAWEGSLRAPDLCNGGPIHLNQGATFTAGVESSTSNTVNVRFHYRDSGTVNCAIPAPAGNTVNSQPCSASWSGTASVVPLPLTSGPTSGTLYYTRFVTENYPCADFCGTSPVNVRKVGFTYTPGQALVLDTPTDVAQVPAADGIARTPQGDLLVGG